MDFSIIMGSLQDPGISYHGEAGPTIYYDKDQGVTQFQHYSE
jgi:hypothetical protein